MAAPEQEAADVAKQGEGEAHEQAQTQPLPAVATDDEPKPIAQQEAPAQVASESAAVADQKGPTNEAIAPAAEKVGQKQVEQDNQTQD